jgi:MFS family permease
MLAVLRQRDYALLWAASTVSVVGDWMLLVALPFYVYDLTGSTLALGLTVATGAIPTLTLGLFAGALVDRWDRRRTAVAVDLLRAAALLPLLTVQSAEAVWVVSVVNLTQSSLGQFFGPARYALVPRLVGKERIGTANALEELSTRTMGIVGPAIGGTLAVAAGLGPVVLLDSATYLVSAALLALVRLPPAPTGPARGAASRPRLLDDLREGLRLVAGDRTLGPVCLAVCFALAGQGLIDALFVPFVKDVLGGDVATLGWMRTAQAAVAIPAGLLVGRWGTRVGYRRLMVVGGAGCGALFAAAANAPSLPIVAALYAAIGLPFVLLFLSHLTLLQASAPDALLGRVVSIVRTATTLTWVVGLGLGAALGPAVGPVALLTLAGALYAAAGVSAILIAEGRGQPSGARAAPAVRRGTREQGAR